MNRVGKYALTCDNRSGPGSVGSAHRGLTHSPDVTGKGLAMKATQGSFHSLAKCINWTGSDRLYQARASAALTGVGLEPGHWAWITARCGNSACLEPDHLVAHAPLWLAYPRLVCIYCGRPGHARDHLLPRRWSGDASRKFVVTVPACGTCNRLLADTLTWSITERRAICRARLRRHFAKTLRAVERTPEELATFGPTLRAFIEDGLADKREVEHMLAWPEDPTYDQRAFENSGIEDAYAVGLLIEESRELLDHVRDVA